jgi:two-component sensor histidine kinase
LALAISAPLAHFYFDDIREVDTRSLSLAAAVVNNGVAIVGFSLLAVLIDLVVKQRAELRVLIHEKNLVLKEVHHRVKNNLQLVSSFLSLEAGKIANPEAAVVFKECRDRIHLMARLHQRLYTKERFASVDLSAHLHEMSETLVHAHSPAGSRIAFQVKANSLIVDVDTAMTLGLIANEVILNSLKHGFKGRDSGILTVQVNEGSQREMVISDDGNGLPHDFNSIKFGGLGFELIQGMSRQIRGEAIIENRLSGGTRTIIRFPSPATTTGDIAQDLKTIKS